jgi:hypothetical protein
MLPVPPFLFRNRPSKAKINAADQLGGLDVMDSAEAPPDIARASFEIEIDEIEELGFDGRIHFRQALEEGGDFARWLLHGSACAGKCITRVSRICYGLRRRRCHISSK